MDLLLSEKNVTGNFGEISECSPTIRFYCIESAGS